jgi:hypothetical protein
MSQDKDPNQGEGDRVSARRYDKHARHFVDEGNVPDAAKEARVYVDRDPDDAANAEAQAKRGPRAAGSAAGVSDRARASVDELVAKGQSVVEKVRPMVSRVVGNLRARFGKK